MSPFSLPTRWVAGAGGGNQEGTPLMWNNTLYGITTWSVVYALDARTGKQLWRWDPEVNQTTVRPKLCCGIVNRGMALHNGTLIAAVNDGRLEALDALTGKPLWESRVAYPQDLYTLTMAPRIAGGTTATAGNLVFQVMNDGRFRAVTADNGEILYEIQTGRTGMAPPITYEVDGNQYVAFQGGLGRAAAAVGPNDTKIDNPPMMFVFALDGRAEMPKPAPPQNNNRNNNAPPPPAPEVEH
jgi:glucose dehydrogenase